MSVYVNGKWILQNPTCDSTVITADTINFQTDGDCLVNGGGAAIPFPTPDRQMGVFTPGPAYAKSEIVTWFFWQQAS